MSLSRRRQRVKRTKKILKILSNDLRLSILTGLRDRQLSFTELMKELKLESKDSSRFSYHLKKLYNCGLVEYDTSSGKYRLSKIGSEIVKWIDRLERVSGDRLEKNIIDLDGEELWLIDVRSYVRDLLKSLRIPARETRNLIRDVCSWLEGFGETIDSQDVQDTLRVFFLRRGFKDPANSLRVIGFNASEIKGRIKEIGNVFLFSIDVGLNVMRKYVMRNLLDDDILKMHLSGDITVNDVECFSFTPQASLMDLTEISEDTTTDMLRRIVDFTLLSTHFSPHKSVDSFSAGLLAYNSSLMKDERIREFFHTLLRLVAQELYLTSRSYSVTFVINALPYKDLDVNYEDFVKLTRMLIHEFIDMSHRDIISGTVLVLRFSDLKDLNPYIDMIYKAFKAHASLVLFKCDNLDCVPYCGVLKVPKGRNVLSTITLNILMALVNSNFDEELLYEKVGLLGKRMNEMLSTKFDDVSFEESALVFSIHGIDQATKAITGRHVFESSESLSFAMKLMHNIRDIFEESLESLIKVVYSLASLDYRVYRVPSSRREPMRSNILKLLESVNMTSALPYNVDMSLDTRVRLEGMFSKAFNGGGFLNVCVSEPFISQEEFTKLLEMVVSSDISNFAVTQDFTCCKICNSRINDIRVRCTRCSFHLSASSHYGRILGYYDRLDKLPRLGRKEYYMRKRVSLVI